MSKYDYIIAGAGLFGCTLARQLTDAGKRCLILERRNVIGGNVRSEKRDGIHVHLHGPHVFHTNSRRVWDYVQRFGSFYQYVHHGRVTSGGRIYSFPLNLFTFNQLWGVTSPAEAKERISKLLVPAEGRTDLKSYALAQMGQELYDLFIDGYTRKQWEMEPDTIPSAVIRRLPFRFDNDDRYFDSLYQGVPLDGYDALVERMAEGIEVKTGVDFGASLGYWRQQGQCVYSGCLDELFGHELGRLEYRSLRFEVEQLPTTFQGCAVMQYADRSVPYTRITEHKFFLPNAPGHTVISREFAQRYDGRNEPYYPINTAANNRLAAEYVKRAEAFGLIVGGRLGTYRYLDMDHVIANAITLADKLTKGVGLSLSA